MKKINFFYLVIILLCIITYLLPNYYDPWRTAYHDFLIILVFILLFFKIIIGNDVFFINKKIILILIISMFPLIQFFFGKIYFFGDAFLAFSYILLFGLAFFVGLNYGVKSGINCALDLIAKIVIIISIISVYIILKQWLLLTNGGIWTVDISFGGRPFANFAQPNNCATFLCIGLVASLYFYEKRYINKGCGVFLASFILLGIALTQSRTAWIFILCFSIWWCWKYKKINPRLNRMKFIYFVFIFIFFLNVIPYISTSLGILHTSDLIERVTTGHLRIPMWKQMLVAITKEPLWGYGWNQVSVAQLSVYLDYPTTEWIEHSHNIILDFIIWNGVPVGVFIVISIAIWFYYLNKTTKSFEVFIALAMVGAVFVHSFLEFPLEYAFFLLPVGFILGLVESSDVDKKLIRYNHKLFLIIPVIFLVFFIWVLVEYKTMENDTRLLKYELLNIGDVHSKSDTPNIKLLTQLSERNKFLRTRPTANMSKEKVEWMGKVAYRYATIPALYRYAQVLALNNEKELAINQLNIIKNLYGMQYEYSDLFRVKDSLAFQWEKPLVDK